MERRFRYGLLLTHKSTTLTSVLGVERYFYQFGKENALPDAAPFKQDSLLWLASCTKLMTAVAVMQQVEQGNVSLDQDLSPILPEFKPPIPVANFDSTGKLILTTTDQPLTLRILLTHTSGLAYEHGCPELKAWRQSLPESSPWHESKMKHDGTIERDFLHPLIFPPGESGRWNYGPSIDWAGKVVERVNPDKLKLGAYLAKYVFKVLGMSDDMTFRPLDDPEKAKRLFARCRTHPDLSLTIDPMEEQPHKHRVDDQGGGGCYGTVRDYIKVLESIMLDDGKLLDSKSVAELLRPQLPEHPVLQAKLQRNDDAQWVCMESADEDSSKVRWSWSLCGEVALDGVPGKCEAGLNFWSGWANTYWVSEVHLETDDGNSK
jgi:CubicO group peptidase (beta-lactamase class C family)